VLSTFFSYQIQNTGDTERLQLKSGQNFMYKNERSEKVSAESMFLKDLYEVEVLAHHNLNS